MLFTNFLPPVECNVKLNSFCGLFYNDFNVVHFEKFYLFFLSKIVFLVSTFKDKKKNF